MCVIAGGHSHCQSDYGKNVRGTKQVRHTSVPSGCHNVVCRQALVRMFYSNLICLVHE